jgi:two-component system alkaline phosphatase synthesis response regulator PhoP
MTGIESLRILLVDDDKDLLDLLKYNFEKEGFDVKTVSKFEKAISAAEKFQPHLIVLDVVMPDGNGIELCRKIRSISSFRSVYIFFLTARSESYYREAALEMGADDFIEKLSGIRALTNKVSAVLKNRFIIKKSISFLSIDNLVINKRLGLVFVKNRRIALNKSEFEILFFFMQNPNKIVSRKNLIKIIWGSDLYMMDSSVENYIQNLQMKVGKDRIQTLNNDRYRFNQTIN